MPAETERPSEPRPSQRTVQVPGCQRCEGIEPTMRPAMSITRKETSPASFSENRNDVWPCAGLGATPIRADAVTLDSPTPTGTPVTTLATYVPAIPLSFTSTTP